MEQEIYIGFESVNREPYVGPFIKIGATTKIHEKIAHLKMMLNVKY